MLVDKLLYKSTFASGTGSSNKKQIPQMKNDKQMKQGDVDLKYSDNVLSCYWYDNKSVLL